MSYDPTQRADQPPVQPPGTPPPAYQPPAPPFPPAYGQPQPPQYPSAVPPTTYAQPGQPPVQPAYGQPGAPSSPNYPAYGQPPAQPAYGQPSSPNYPAYGQPSSPEQPAYGQPSSPNYPAYGQPGAPAYGVPADQPPAWGGTLPSGYPSTPPAPKKKSPALLITIIVLVIVVIAGAGGGGYAYYLSTRPKPVITIDSQYKDGATPVGATSTKGFSVKGTDFSPNEEITFLNDGAPGFPGTVTSDSKGGVTATLTVGPGWTPGSHTITAKDKDGYITKVGVKVEIVTAGTKGTPGPNGAPTDTANMIVTAIVSIGGNTETDLLTVKNGSVCAAGDDGVPHSSNHTTSGGTPYVETVAKTCSGTYQGGKLTYTETYTVLKAVYQGGLVCSIPKPFVAAHLDGTFSSATAVSGTYTSESTTFDCGSAGSVPIGAQNGTWTGVAVVS